MNKFIQWDSLEFRKERGKEKVRCPECDGVRSDKRDKSLAINHNEGYGKCFYCEALTFRDNENSYENKEVVYELPPQDWENHTKLSDKLVKFIKTDRGISQKVLIELGITEEKFYQPKHQKEVNNIVFNYFEGDKLVNKKYRSPSKAFTQSTGGKPIFYNINSVIGQSECYIVEGEFDVLAMREAGIKNCISVPNGANDNDDYWKNSEKYLEGIETVIIAVDNDEKGNILRDKIAQRLGRWRCKYIEWTDKDANDSLKKGTLTKEVENAKRFPVSGTFTVGDVKDGIFDLYDNGLPKTIYPKHKCFGKLKDVFSVMRGQLTVVTGIPSHGKSNFVDWYVLNIVNDYNLKASFFTPEHSPMELYQTTLIQKATGKNFWSEKNGIKRVTKDDINVYEKWAREKIYMTLPEKGDQPDWDWIFDKFKEQMYAYGVDIFVIDAFNKIKLDSTNGRLGAISDVLSRLTVFAQVNNVIIFLVAHPTKMKKDDSGTYEIPTLYDVSGSADFRNQTHNGFAIHRYFENQEVNGFTRFVNLKTKFSFQGKITEFVDFMYHNETGRMYAMDQNIPYFDMTRKEKPKQPKAVQVEASYTDMRKYADSDFDPPTDEPF